MHPLKKNLSLLLSVLGLLLFTISAASQPAVAPTSSEKILTVSVWLKNGFLVSLKKDDFEIFEGKTLLPITSFTQKETPHSIGIIVDLSGSMGPSSLPMLGVDKLERDRIQWAVNGLSKFVDASNPQNEYFILTFAKEQNLRLDWSSDKNVILQDIRALAEIKPKGQTKFYDALDFGLEKVSSGRYRKSLIVITDGMDNLSKKTDYEDLKKLTRQQDVRIYFVHLLSELDRLALSRPRNGLMVLGPTLDANNKLRTLAANTGGSVYYAERSVHSDLIFALIALELRSLYDIGVTVTPRNKPKWNEVQIRLRKETEKRFKDVTILGRNGIYF